MARPLNDDAPPHVDVDAQGYTITLANGSTFEIDNDDDAAALAERLCFAVQRRQGGHEHTSGGIAGACAAFLLARGHAWLTGGR